MVAFSASGREIADITGLEHCTNLQQLVLWNNQIADISPLAVLTSLTELNLGINQIHDISPLSSMAKLIWLDLWKNRISDISPLIENAGLAAGDKVHLENNQLDDRSVSDFIPQLQERGVEVTW